MHAFSFYFSLSFMYCTCDISQVIMIWLLTEYKFSLLPRRSSLVNSDRDEVS
ncbi:uncharacterized protein BDW43DRAFT_258561 [Aspergillus alliaceus]|uniref:uncharacterized protein n=1 Tax=Petromyces alliaceus TaxID=209559 RepID=UPI0012A4DBBD|nr:uncharacterized protein BDW43DRAFT_258561 [Aspergillus alliaceus]KAB8239589.1 hypothetical protein BDW43DRAFT_258561 [Aspergillus alliaceus]